MEFIRIYIVCIWHVHFLYMVSSRQKCFSRQTLYVYGIILFDMDYYVIQVGYVKIIFSGVELGYMYVRIRWVVMEFTLENIFNKNTFQLERNELTKG